MGMEFILQMSQTISIGGLYSGFSSESKDIEMVHVLPTHQSIVLEHKYMIQPRFQHLECLPNLKKKRVHMFQEDS